MRLLAGKSLDLPIVAALIVRRAPAVVPTKEMNMFRILAVSACLAFAGAAFAQQPYAGQHLRDIKALSPEEVNQFVNGAGAGFAKAAELNHYPGPQHALELADQLGLSRAQRIRTKELLNAHKAEARAIGTRVVDAERDLEMLFRRGNVGGDELAAAVRRAAALQGEYRLSHLETHRTLRALLTEDQVARYDALRGYAAGGDKQSAHKH